MDFVYFVLGEASLGVRISVLNCWNFFTSKNSSYLENEELGRDHCLRSLLDLKTQFIN